MDSPITRLIADIKNQGKEAREKGICVSCKKPIRFYSDAGRKEYEISGLCEYCFDEATKEPKE